MGWENSWAVANILIMCEHQRSIFSNTHIRKTITSIVCHEISILWIGFAQKRTQFWMLVSLKVRQERHGYLGEGEHEQRHRETQYWMQHILWESGWTWLGEKRWVLRFDWRTVGTDDTSLSSVHAQWAGRSQCACCFISSAGWVGLESLLNMLDAKPTWVELTLFGESLSFFTRQRQSWPLLMASGTFPT